MSGLSPLRERSRAHSPQREREHSEDRYESARRSSRRSRSRSRSRSRDHSPRRSSHRDERRDERRSRSPRRDPPSAPRGQPSHPRAMSPDTVQLVEYEIVLPNPVLIRFLIGPGGSRSRQVKAFSNLVRLTFAEENTIDGRQGTGTGLGKLRGSEESIRRALECVRMLVRDEVDLERHQGVRPRFEYGDVEVWASFETDRVVWLGKTKAEYYAAQKLATPAGGLHAPGSEHPGGPWVSRGQAGQNQGRPLNSAHQTWPSNSGSVPTGPTGHIPTGPAMGNSYGASRGSSYNAQGSYPTGPAQAYSSGYAGSYPQQPYAGNLFGVQFRTAEEKDRREKDRGPTGAPDISIPVPQVAVAALIGPKGATIRLINTESGAYCRLDRSGAAPLLHAYGELSTIEKAMQLVDEIVVRYDPTWQGGMNQPNVQAEEGEATADVHMASAHDQLPPRAPVLPYDHIPELGQSHANDDSRSRSISPQREKSRIHDESRSRPSNVPEKRVFTDDELIEVLDGLPAGMLERVLVRRFTARNGQ